MPEPQPVEFAALEGVAAAVADAAAQMVRDELGSATAIRTKTSPTDVLTATDLRVEEFIRERLRELSPGSSVVGEELGRSEGAGDVEWIVDPVDGTVNLLYGLPVVSVSIAAAVESEVVAGAVADVLTGEVFAGAKNSGAHLDGEGIKVNDTLDPSDALVGIGFSYSAEQRADEARVLQTLLPSVRDIRCMGSAALNLAWVACGRLDAYCEGHVEPWDVAAGALIVREAGGDVSLSSTSESASIVAAPPGIFDAICDLSEGLSR